jgi:hypothetical protein
MDQEDKEGSINLGSRDSQTPKPPLTPMNKDDEVLNQAVDITQSFNFGGSSPKRRNFRPSIQESMDLDKMSLEDFSFPQ